MARGFLTPARMAVLAAVALVSACASTPAPITQGGAWRPPVAVAEAPPDLSEFEPGQDARIDDSGTPLQCVPFARNHSGVEIYGNANTWWTQAAGRYPRSNSPAPGSVFVMRGYRDDSRGHVAVVTEIVSPRVIRVNQANWLNRGEVTTSVPVMDVSPNNDWTQVRVWYIPNNQWGARTYLARGFIHPFTLMAMS
jgi:hypothetical protein